MPSACGKGGEQRDREGSGHHDPCQAIVLTLARPHQRVSGFIRRETGKRLAGSPYAIAEKLGRGRVMQFADDPNFRLRWPRLTPLFMNAVWLAPSVP